MHDREQGFTGETGRSKNRLLKPNLVVAVSVVTALACVTYTSWESRQASRQAEELRAHCAVLEAELDHVCSEWQDLVSVVALLCVSVPFLAARLKARATVGPLWLFAGV